MSIDFNKLKPSASMEVTKIAGELKKAGRTVYPLSAGDTHFPPPAAIAAKLTNLPPAYSHYTNAEGILELRNQIAQTLPGFDAKDILLVPGLKQGFYYTLQSLLKKNICILEPAWLGYQATAALAGYDYLAVNMYQPNWIEQLLNTSFESILVCAPNNPDGKIFSNAETDAILEAAQKNDAWIITDLIYDKYCYTPGYQEFFTKITSYPKLVIGNGFSKSHAMTGFRIGYLATKDASLLKRILVMQQNIATCPSAIAQYLLLDYQLADEEVNGFFDYYSQNRNLITEIFPEWEQIKPNGGFYYFVDLKPYGIDDAQPFCEKILQEKGIALVPGNAYGTGFDSFVRLSFSIDKEQLKEALLILREFFN